MEFIKTLAKEDMYFYIHKSLYVNILESTLIVFSLIFLVWVAFLALEKDSDEACSSHS